MFDLDRVEELTKAVLIEIDQAPLNEFKEGRGKIPLHNKKRSQKVFNLRRVCERVETTVRPGEWNESERIEPVLVIADEQGAAV